MGLFDWLKKRKTDNSLEGVMGSRVDKVLSRGPFPKCGGCGSGLQSSRSCVTRRATVAISALPVPKSTSNS